MAALICNLCSSLYIRLVPKCVFPMLCTNILKHLETCVFANLLVPTVVSFFSCSFKRVRFDFVGSMCVIEGGRGYQNWTLLCATHGGPVLTGVIQVCPKVVFWGEWDLHSFSTDLEHTCANSWRHICEQKYTMM